MTTTSASSKSRGIIKSGLLIIAGVGAIAGTILVATTSATSSSATKNSSQQSSDSTSQNSSLAGMRPMMLLTQLGLSPQHLAAAGVSLEQTDSIIKNTRDFCTEHGDAYDAAMQALIDARGRRAALNDRLSRGENIDQTTITECHSSCDLAEQSLNALLDQARTAALAGISENQKLTLNNLDQNKNWAVPVEFKVINRTESEWVKLQAAYTCVQTPVDDENSNRVAQSLITAAAADSNTVAAKVSLANAAAIENLWNQSLLPANP